MTRTYFAGSRRRAGTGMGSNVTGDCPHNHRTPEAAQNCINKMDRSIKRQQRNAYCDRVVMVRCGDTDPEWSKRGREFPISDSDIEDNYNMWGW